jgi:peptidoglycan/LPS O-acetylase OafA/YrhL
MNKDSTASAVLYDAASANLNFLRSFAVLLVVAAHTLKAFGADGTVLTRVILFGKLGVLYFFVHTALVLMFSLERQRKKYGEQRLFSIFMIRRIFRIYPLSVLAVLVVFLFKIPAVDIAKHHVLGKSPDAVDLISNLLLVQNVVRDGDGSFLGPLWSLPYEVQMYLALPLLFLIARRFKGSELMLVLWAFAGLAFVILDPQITKFNAHFEAFQIPRTIRYVPCFIPGIIAYKLAGDVRRTLPFAVLPALLAVLSGLFLLSYDPRREMFVCLILGLSVPFIQEPVQAFFSRTCALIARYSYGIYLAHVPCIWLAFDVLRHQNAAVQILVFLIAVSAVPVLLYHLVESPMIGVGQRVVDRWVAGRGEQPALVLKAGTR